MKNLKYIMATLMVALIVAVVCVSCKKEKEQSTISSENQPQNEIINNDDITADLLFFQNLDICKEPVPGGFLAKIIHIDLRRKSTHCQEGLGICNVYIFGQQIYKSDSDFGSLEPSREIDYAILIDTTAKSVDRHMELTLLLSSDVSGYKTEELQLYVDEDIYGYDNDSDDMIVVPEGVYQYDSSLGKFGGYTVNYVYSLNKEG